MKRDGGRRLCCGSGFGVDFFLFFFVCFPLLLLLLCQNIPIFPDFENHHNKYVVVQFEDDPKKSVKLALERNLDPTVKLQNEEGQEMVNTAVTIGSRGEDNEPFLGYYVPVDDEIERRKQRRTGASE